MPMPLHAPIVRHESLITPGMLSHAVCVRPGYRQPVLRESTPALNQFDTPAVREVEPHAIARYFLHCESVLPRHPHPVETSVRGPLPHFEAVLAEVIPVPRYVLHQRVNRANRVECRVQQDRDTGATVKRVE